METSVAREMASQWWAVSVRGILAVIFGVLAFAMPSLTVAALVMLFGIYALADGIMALISGVRGRDWPLLFLAVLGIGVGIYTFVRPGVTAVALLYLIAAWAIARGLFEIVAAIRLRKYISNEWFLALTGALSILLGIALFSRPGAGALAMVWLIGAYALALGLLLIVLAFRLRGLPERLENGRGEAAVPS